MIPYDLIEELKELADKGGDTIICITDTSVAMSGRARQIYDAMGNAYLGLYKRDAHIAKVFITGCGSIVYGAAMSGMLDDVLVDQLYEALAIAKAQRANKQGREN